MVIQGREVLIQYFDYTCGYWSAWKKGHYVPPWVQNRLIKGTTIVEGGFDYIVEDGFDYKYKLE
jgi:hypothetical protein